KHGGTIDKFMGDGIMATFGATNPSKTYAADALRALDDIVADLKSWETDPDLSMLSPLCVNLAIATGPVTFGAVGDEHRLEYTVIGAAVNLSAKLEKFNKVLKTNAIVDKASYDTATAQGYSPLTQPGIVNHNIEGTNGKHELCILY
ncbi:MAG: adenylate/guanylate cyclase domain-containing protein, partial [Roseicyclus sp.]|nr:adenylate/guanylate cyclase domain-containing protein [Roseicyclus sp.]